MKRLKYIHPEITNKKLIIIEGLDRVGKNTLIDNLTNDLILANKQIKNFHFTSPNKEEVIKHYGVFNNETAYNYQKDIFSNIFDETLHYIEGTKNEKVVIWNRSHLGEYVYGQIFRGLTPSGIQKEINDMNFYLLDHIPRNNIFLVTMICTDYEFLERNEDGNSFSSDKETKEKEVTLFTDIHNKFPINDRNKILIDIANEKYMNKPENVYYDVLSR